MKLYTTHCPKCKVLETKLNQKNIIYESIEDTKVMEDKGFNQYDSFYISDSDFRAIDTAILATTEDAFSDAPGSETDSPYSGQYPDEEYPEDEYDEYDEGFKIVSADKVFSLPESAKQYASKYFDVPVEVGENCESLIFYK